MLQELLSVFSGSPKIVSGRKSGNALSLYSGHPKRLLGFSLLLGLGVCGVCQAFVSSASLNDAYLFLNRVMDRPVERFWVYDDFICGHNRAAPSGHMGSTGTMEIREDWTEDPLDGVTCIRAIFSPTTPVDWAGIYWQVVEDNWGQLSDVGVDLTGATRVRFWAKSGPAGAKIEFFAGGMGWDGQPYPDSSEKNTTEPTVITLTDNWQPYEISLDGADLSYVIGPFGFALNAPNNENGATFFLDRIEIDCPNDPNTPRFLPSYKVQGVGSPDLYITNPGFLYDQALVALAYMARGTEDDLRRVRIILDAVCFAQESDRAYTDGRLRNAYMAGWLPDQRTKKARLPGWHDYATGNWGEDRVQVGTHAGNLAWSMIALLHYNVVDPKPEYVQAAVSMGDWLEANAKDSSGAGGYIVGYEGWEPAPQLISAKSTEQNIDLACAFGLLYEATGDDVWRSARDHANRFVMSMWQPGFPGHFALGTLEDAITVRDDCKVLDPQTWSILALDLSGTTHREESLQWVEENLLVRIDDVEGVDFNDDRDGIWPEGCGQFILSNAWARKTDRAEDLLSSLETFQSPEGGFWAASKDNLSTGLTWEYFHRVALAPTAWYVLAAQSWNPFIGVRLRPLELTSLRVKGEAGSQQLVVAWTSTKGKTYQVVATSDLTHGDAWQDVGDPKPGTGGILEYNEPINGAQSKYYRVRED
jgi:hypothetical protein